MTEQAKRARREQYPERPDVHMDRLLESSRRNLAKAGLNPGKLPWAWRGTMLYSVSTGKRLATAPRTRTSYFNQWLHKVDDDRYSRRRKGMSR